jgi:hypothetical protein
MTPLRSRAIAWRSPLAALWTVALIACLGSCGGGGSGSMSSTSSMMTDACTASSCGNAMVTLTDAPGDFLLYQVNLVSLVLNKADGSTVETLPATTQVNLAGLVDLTELVSATLVPAGAYVGASITLDYSGATIIVDDGSANGLAVSAVDSSGNPLGQLTLAVQLDSAKLLFINPGQLARLALDFNLLASNTVNTAMKTVTVSPVLIASVEPIDQKQVRLRGTLVAADTANNDYTINLEPFDELHAMSTGQATVHVTDTTSYEINGMPATGAKGLALLAALPAGSWTVALGSFSSTDQSFTATQVFAGTSVVDSGLDQIYGYVVARSGDSLTVRGALWQKMDGDVDLQPGEVTVTLASTTVVTEQGEAGSTGPTIANISVGSRLVAFGKGSTDGSGHVSLDASTGRVRLELSDLVGSVLSVGNGSLTLSLWSLDGRDPGLFTFTGTGGSGGHDSDPTHYVVSTGGLSPAAIGAGATLHLFGFVAPYGSAPPDFDAGTVVTPPTLPILNVAVLGVLWASPGTLAPFAAIDSSHLVVNVVPAASGELAWVQNGGSILLLTSRSANPSIVPDDSAPTTAFAIAHTLTATVSSYTSFADFTAALQTDLSGTVAVAGLVASGSWDASSGTFTTSAMVVKLSD